MHGVAPAYSSILRASPDTVTSCASVQRHDTGTQVLVPGPLAGPMAQCASAARGQTGPVTAGGRHTGPSRPHDGCRESSWGTLLRPVPVSNVTNLATVVLFGLLCGQAGPGSCRLPAKKYPVRKSTGINAGIRNNKFRTDSGLSSRQVQASTK